MSVPEERSQAAGAPELTIAITTRNRSDDLRRALESCMRQTGRLEVLVIDDGSTDGTVDLVRREFPGVRLVRFEESGGCVRRRNEAAALARAPFVLSMDDDAELSGADIVEVARGGFEDPRVGALAIPYVDVRQDPGAVKQGAPAAGGPFVFAGFRGTAHAIRRDVFLALGGYREAILHQGEEMDYCIRLLDAGYVVAGFATDPILHHESPRREFDRIDVLGRRNDVLFAWWNVPMPYLPVHLAATVVNGIRFGVAEGRLEPMLRGIAMGLRDVLALGVPRRAVRARTYRLHRRLKKRGPVPLASIADLLPPSVGAKSVSR